MEGSITRAIRTGAMTGIAAKYLAMPDTSPVGIIGPCPESHPAPGPVCRPRHIREVKFDNRTRETAVRFTTEMVARTGETMAIVDSPEDAVRGLDLALVATTAHQPLMKGERLSPGMLSSISSDTSATSRVRARLRPRKWACRGESRLPPSCAPGPA